MADKAISERTINFMIQHPSAPRPYTFRLAHILRSTYRIEVFIDNEY
jgi:hypothetical protein